MQDLAKAKRTLSKNQIEILRLVAEGRLDPVFFGQATLGLKFYDEQKIWLWASTKTQKEKCIETAKKINFAYNENDFDSIEDYFERVYTEVDQHILCTANQIGKTFLTAVKHCWSLYYKIGRTASGNQNFMKMEYKTLNVSPHSDQSAKCKEYVENLFKGQLVYFNPITKTLEANNVHPVVSGFILGGNANLGELICKNGSIFYSKSTGQDKGTSRAGEQFGYISYDECAQSRHLQEELPMLQSRILRYGYCFDLISSPEAGKPSHLYYSRLVKDGHKLEEGKTWWSFTGISFEDNIFIAEEQKQKSMKRIMDTDPEKAKQMLRGLFITTGDKLLSLELVKQIFDAGPKKPQMEYGEPGRKYLITADWGMSDTGDNSAFFVIDYTDMQTQNIVHIVNHEVIKGGSPTMQFTRLRIMFENFGGHGLKDDAGNWRVHPVKVVTDSNSLGGVIIKKMISELKPYGFGSKGGQKDQMIAEAYNMLNFKREFEIDKSTGDIHEKNKSFGMVRSYYIPKLEEQLGVYKVDDEKIEQDLVVSLFMGLWFLRKKIPSSKIQKLDINPNSGYNNSVLRQ